MDQRSHHRPTTTYRDELAAMATDRRSERYRRLRHAGFEPHDALPGSRIAVEAKCELCLDEHGHQYLPDIIEVPVCSDCFGTGRVPFSQMTCPLCKGTGVAK